MNIHTKTTTTSDNETSLVVTMKDCEGFTINERMDYEEAKNYFLELKLSLKKTEAFLAAE